MPSRFKLPVRIAAIAALAMAAVLGVAYTRAPAQVANATPARLAHPLCDNNSAFCAETMEPWNYKGTYTGHDEPSVLFYSDKPGSGNSNLYTLTLPKDPPTQPKQDGTGGTYNFQLHPAFWFGMAMCDSQSAPMYTNQCAPDSDSNIYDGTDPNAPDYIGKHPGTAFMEMQFYPPAWTPWPAGVSCDPTKWCAALNIDSLSENMNTNQVNNSACLNSVGIEYVNFAFITKNGVAQAPADPVDATLATYTPDPKRDLFMNSGDRLTVDMHDTSAGFTVIIHDLTTGQTGSMTASIANHFGQVKFDPTGSTCQNIPYGFHPMYSTSSEHTRVPWAAHSYNVAFSDEIGHFEYCNTVDTSSASCTAAGANDPSGLDGDDSYCFDASQSLKVPVSGCLSTDSDFDGVPYQNTWPGSLSNPGQDHRVNPTSILFTSPLFRGQGEESGWTAYKRVAFETDLPRIEFATSPACNRSTGADCVNPPVGATFYPFYSTRQMDGVCVWQLGGAYIPGTTNTFGGSSAAEFGGLLQLAYPTLGGPIYRYNNFRRVLSNNPCGA